MTRWTGVPLSEDQMRGEIVRLRAVLQKVHDFSFVAFDNDAVNHRKALHAINHMTYAPLNKNRRWALPVEDHS